MNLWTPLLELMDHSVALSGDRVKVSDASRVRSKMEKLAQQAALAEPEMRRRAQWLVRAIALELGAVPASIHTLYRARGRGEVPPNFTVPAINLRALPFYAARRVFRVMRDIDAAAVIFEIARSEIGYTAQRPAEYAAQILAAAVAEGYQGPVFIQGDHFQVSPKRYAEAPEEEEQALRNLIAEALQAGFFNIDIDASTLVDIHKPTIEEQQVLNVRLSAELTAYLRGLEPEGVTVSVGGEIGEVGGHNSTEPELRAYMDGYNAALAELAPGAPGLSKISIQTGTSHGGVVLPDGTLAQVKVDFDTLRHLSRVAREVYGLGGAVQHGASTLPPDAFSKFPEAEAVEIHLATNFMNVLYDLIPDDLRREMYAYVAEHHANERKPGMTEEQFYYKARKRAIGPFKAYLWALDEAVKEAAGETWEAMFRNIFAQLGIAGTREVVERFVRPVALRPDLKAYLGAEAGDDGDLSDLAD